MYDKAMKGRFEILDHTADVGIIAYGADVEEVFSNAGLALFSLITEPETVAQKSHVKLNVNGNGRDELLVGWLNELIYFFDAEHLLFSRFNIESLTQNELQATCWGERFDPTRHRIKRGVKAATYHMLTLDKNCHGYKAQIILDV